MIEFLLLFLSVQNADYDLISRLVAAECSICNEQEISYVTSTIFTRVIDEDFPNAVEEVIFQPNQFATPVKDIEPFTRVASIVYSFKNNFLLYPKVLYFCTGEAYSPFLYFVKDGGFKLEYHYFK